MKERKKEGGSRESEKGNAAVVGSKTRTEKRKEKKKMDMNEWRCEEVISSDCAADIQVFQKGDCRG